MQMLYDSESFVVVQIHANAPEASAPASAVPHLARHGFEIVDKRSGKEVYLDGSWAEMFQQRLVAWQKNTPTQDEVEAMLDNRQIRDPITSEERRPDERFLRAVEEKIHISDSGKQSFRQEVVRKAMSAFKRGEAFGLASHAQLHDAVQQYLFEQRRDVLRLVDSAKRPDDDVRARISAVEQRLVDEYGYDVHSAREALNYVTTLLAQE